MTQLNAIHKFFPELFDAFHNGYPHNFILTPSGRLRCLSLPNQFYELEEVNITLVKSTLPATLYLITTKDGLYAGTLVEYWEHSS